MLIAFLGIPILLADLYGGFVGINAFPACDNIVPFPLSSSGFIGCIGVTSFFFNFYPPVGQSDVSTGGWGDFNPGFSAPSLAGCEAILNAGNASHPSFATCAGVIGTAAAVDAQQLFSYVPVGNLELFHCFDGEWRTSALGAKDNFREIRPGCQKESDVDFYVYHVCSHPRTYVRVDSSFEPPWKRRRLSYDGGRLLR